MSKGVTTKLLLLSTAMEYVTLKFRDLKQKLSSCHDSLCCPGLAGQFSLVIFCVVVVWGCVIWRLVWAECPRWYSHTSGNWCSVLTGVPLNCQPKHIMWPPRGMVFYSMVAQFWDRTSAQMSILQHIGDNCKPNQKWCLQWQRVTSTTFSWPKRKDE